MVAGTGERLWGRFGLGHGKSVLVCHKESGRWKIHCDIWAMSDSQKKVGLDNSAFGFHY
jgi:hypothetical protein